MLSNPVSFLSPSVFDCISIVILPNRETTYVYDSFRKKKTQFKISLCVSLCDIQSCVMQPPQELGHTSNYDQVTF